MLAIVIMEDGRTGGYKNLLFCGANKFVEIQFQLLFTKAAIIY